MKESMIRTFNWIQTEHLKASNKSEWPILLHNLCYFHSCLKLRSRYARCGWNVPLTMNFSNEEFVELLQAAVHEYLIADNRTPTDSIKTINELNKNISLQIIKYLASQIIYGSSIIDEYDAQTIESVADYWIASIAIRKDFEISKLKYKLPQAFYNQSPKLSVLQQAIDSSINHLQLDSPEGT
jgi:hypothetical protein